MTLPQSSSIPQLAKQFIQEVEALGVRHPYLLGSPPYSNDYRPIREAYERNESLTGTNHFGADDLKLLVNAAASLKGLITMIRIGYLEVGMRLRFEGSPNVYEVAQKDFESLTCTVVIAVRHTPDAGQEIDKIPFNRRVELYRVYTKTRRVSRKNK